MFNSSIMESQGRQFCNHLLAQRFARNIGVVLVAATVRYPHFAPIGCRSGRIDMQAHEHGGTSSSSFLHSFRKTNIYIR